MFEKSIRITFLTGISGSADPANGMLRPFSFEAGQTVEIPTGLARKWIASGTATDRELSVREWIALARPVA